MGSTTGSSLSARTLSAGPGITINTTNNSSVTISTSSAGLIGDSSPTLSAPMNANGLAIGRVPDPSDELVASFNAIYAAINVTTTIDQLAINKGYADTHYVQIGDDGQVVGPLRVRAEPSTPDLNNPNYNVE
jgi:hypothetical protein